MQPAGRQMQGMPLQGQGMPMQGQGMPMQGQGMPMQGQGMPMQGQGLSMQGMPMQGQGMSMQGQGMPMQGQGMPMQGQGIPMQYQGMPIQGQQMPIQGQQMPIQGQQMPMQGQGMPMQGQGIPMQGQGMPMQGQGMPIQGQGLPMPAQSMPIPAQSQGMPMPAQGQGMPMQSQGMPMPSQGIPMQGQGQRMMMQGQQNMPQSVTGPMPQAMIGGGQMYVGPQRFGGPMTGPQMMPGAAIGMRMPPSYTPDMAKEFHTRQQILQREQVKIMEKQRKKIEQEMKQRQFQETQKRLKEYATIGGRKLDVDSAIHTIIGSPEHKAKLRRQQQQQQQMQQQQLQHQQMQQQAQMQQHAPIMSAIQQPQIMGNQPLHPMDQPVSIQDGGQLPAAEEDDFADFMSCPAPSTVNQSDTHTTTANQSQAPATGTTNQNTQSVKKEEKKAPKEAKSFRTRTAVKDVTPVHRSATYHQSQRARTWSNETEQQAETLSELFTLPEPEPPAAPAKAPAAATSPAASIQAPAASVPAPHHPHPPHTAPPQPQPAGVGKPPGAGGLPPWLTGKAPVPPVYNMVLEASLKDGAIDTGMLYPILIRSQLPKEVLGHLWKLCNKQTPGKLLKEELYMLLAMICVAQNNMNITSLDILLHCPQAPVPNLGQHELPGNTGTSPAPVTGTSPSPGVGQISPPQAPGTHGVHTAGVHTKGAASMPVIAGAGVQQTGKQTAVTTLATSTMTSSSSHVTSQAPAPPDDDDFADFQTASFKVAEPEDDFGDFKSVPVASNQPQSVIPQPVPNQKQPHRTSTVVISGSIIKNESCASTLSVPQKATSPKPIHKVASDLIGENDRYSAFRVELEASSHDEPGTSVQISPPKMLDNIQRVEHSVLGTSLPKSSPKMLDDPESNFADFSAFKDTSSSSDFQSFSSTPSSANQDLTVSSHDSLSSPNQRSDNWGSSSSNQSKDNKSGLESAEEDFGDFAEFKQATTVVSSGARINTGPPDKLSAIRALVMDTKLYTEKPATESTQVKPTGGDLENDDWDPFVKSGGEGSSIPAPIVHDNTPISWDSNPANNSNEKAEEGWADFASVRTTTNKTADEDFGSFQSQPLPTGAIKRSAEEPRMKVDQRKANALFAHNTSKIQTTMHHSSSGTGMSALDTEPPELPDFPDDDHEDHHVSGHDKFGTFLGHPTMGFDLDSPTMTTGISSLVTPYGGFDYDMEESSTNKKPSFNIEDTSKESNNLKSVYSTVGTRLPNSQSASSFEFTGWTNQSKGVIEGDTLSMQSLDLKTVGTGESQEGSPAEADSQSVSSLDFNEAGGAKKTVQVDQRSIGSLDLRSPTDDTEKPQETVEGVEAGLSGMSGMSGLSGAGGMEESFGEFNSAPVRQEPVKPRDVSEIMTSEAPINMVDRYSTLMGDPEDSDRHLFCWEKCLRECENIIEKANTTFNNIPSLEVCKEVMECPQGSQYLQGVTEIYRVARRIKLAMHALAMSSDSLEDRQKEIHNQWNNLVSFMTNSELMPTSQSLSFKKSLLSKDTEDLTARLCGVCLLDAEVYSDSTSANENAGHKLSYGGRSYHAPCANFWVNCIDSTLPALKVTELW